MQGGLSRQVEAHGSLVQVILYTVQNTLAAAIGSPVVDEQHKCRQGGILHYELI